MNEPLARGRHTISGWLAEFRPFWKADFQQVVRWDKHTGKKFPLYFQTEMEAENCGWKMLNKVQHPMMLRYGEVMKSTRFADAEALFKKG